MPPIFTMQRAQMWICFTYFITVASDLCGLVTARFSIMLFTSTNDRTSEYELQIFTCSCEEKLSALKFLSRWKTSGCLCDGPDVWLRGNWKLFYVFILLESCAFLVSPHLCRYTWAADHHPARVMWQDHTRTCFCWTSVQWCLFSLSSLSGHSASRPTPPSGRQEDQCRFFSVLLVSHGTMVLKWVGSSFEVGKDGTGWGERG